MCQIFHSKRVDGTKILGVYSHQCIKIGFEIGGFSSRMEVLPVFWCSLIYFVHVKSTGEQSNVPSQIDYFHIYRRSFAV